MTHACRRPLVTLFLALGMCGTLPRALAEAPVAAKIENFELRDFRGKNVALASFADARAVVVVFLGTECPLATLYAPRLVQLAERFADEKVVFLGIDSNQQDSITDLAHYAKTHDLNFALLKDVGNEIADLFGAERTPEVFLLDAERRVRYRGRIDDQYLVGRQREKPTREDLACAIEEVLAGQEVSEPATEALGCLIGRIRQPKDDAPVTYARHIAPLLNRRCVECHREGEIAPFELTQYDEVAGWAEMILEVVEQNRMPPWHANPEFGEFANEQRLSDQEKQLLRDWVEAGAPEGDASDLPAPPKFAEGWRLPRVDQVVYMSDKEYDVPAEGTVQYQYFSVDPGFTEDKWVQAAECRPGNRAVVHHIIVDVRPPRGGRDGGHAHSEWLSATAPGARPLLLEEGMAKFIPAGSKLVFQLHYTPNGSPQKDRSSIGLMFADAAKVRKEVATVEVVQHFFLIPPGVPDYRTDAWRTIDEDTLLLSMFPHMHLRGKSFRYEARYPDGSTEVLLDVPQYDFNWQNTYELATPKLLPKGTKLHCVAHFDNSVDNVANPNPKRAVYWGEQTWDEMMIGYMDVVPVGSKGREPEQADRGEQTD